MTQNDICSVPKRNVNTTYVISHFLTIMVCLCSPVVTGLLFISLCVDMLKVFFYGLTGIKDLTRLLSFDFSVTKFSKSP